MNKLILPTTAKPIKNSINHWIDIDGSIYAIDSRNNHNKLIKKTQREISGYKYCKIRFKNYEQGKSVRVHRLVAEAFIDNPNNYKIVEHKNNIKNDNRVENLYWTTISENTKKAYEDNLAKNDAGYSDSQSKPVIMFNTYTNKEIKRFGSISEASDKTQISKSTISRQACYKRATRKPFYFRFQDDESLVKNNNVAMYDFDTDKLLKVFINASEASKKEHIPQRTICEQLKLNRKPLKKLSKYYFLYFS